MTTQPSRQDLEVAALAGNGWATQQLLRRFGTAPVRPGATPVDAELVAEYNARVHGANAASRINQLDEQAAVQKYSPNQARDEHGRFSSSGASATHDAIVGTLNDAVIGYTYSGKAGKSLDNAAHSLQAADSAVRNGDGLAAQAAYSQASTQLQAASDNIAHEGRSAAVSDAAQQAKTAGDAAGMNARAQAAVAESRYSADGAAAAAQAHGDAASAARIAGQDAAANAHGDAAAAWSAVANSTGYTADAFVASDKADTLSRRGV